MSKCFPCPVDCQNFNFSTLPTFIKIIFNFCFLTFLKAILSLWFSTFCPVVFDLRALSLLCPEEMKKNF